MMKNYKIEIQELLSRIIEIEAPSTEEAIDKSMEMYRAEEIYTSRKLESIIPEALIQNDFFGKCNPESESEWRASTSILSRPDK